MRDRSPLLRSRPPVGQPARHGTWARSDSPPISEAAYPRFRRAMGTVVAVQLVHTVEHAVQLWQRLALHQASPKGLLGAWLNFEWVHFVFNIALGALMLLLFFGYRMWTRPWSLVSPVGWAMVIAVIVEFGLHLPEHMARIYQYWRYGWNPAPGILGHTALHGSGPFDVVYLHAVYNFTVTALLVTAFLAYSRALRVRAPAESARAPESNGRGIPVGAG